VSLIGVFSALMAMLCFPLGVIWFAYAGVAAARDLNHLLRLQLVDVTGGAGASEDDGDILETILDLT